MTAIEDIQITCELYPNPATTTFRTSVLFGSSKIWYEIIDMSGKTMSARAGSSNETFDVSGLPKGKYLLRGTEKGNVATLAFLKE